MAYFISAQSDQITANLSIPQRSKQYSLLAIDQDGRSVTRILSMEKTVVIPATNLSIKSLDTTKTDAASLTKHA